MDNSPSRCACLNKSSGSNEKTRLSGINKDSCSSHAACRSASNRHARLCQTSAARQEAQSYPYVQIFRTMPVETVCPNFYVLDHARGCGFKQYCNYCYLKDPYYNYGERVVYTNLEQMTADVTAWIKNDDVEAHGLNSGNLSDSLSFEHARPLMGKLLDIFQQEATAKGRRHSLILVTKGGVNECAPLLEHEPCENVIASFSLNTPSAAERLEAGAAPIAERLRAAKMLKQQGWRLRLRIDPMIAGENYETLARDIGEILPERVTLGSLRADYSLYVSLQLPEFSLLQPPESEEALARYPWEIRVGLYRPVVAILQPICSLGLCEESPAMWSAVGLDPEKPTCNCAAD